jgi:histone demethylase JARID1
MTETKNSVQEELKTNIKMKNTTNNVDFVFDPVPEAPTFKPNDQEFKDPLVYINQIRPIAEQFGICKIIPPKTWKPKFCIDMNTFKFTPRVQRLNELEANTRIKINFLEKLSKFWELQGNKFKIPIMERKPVDLYKLFKQVEIMGGYETIVKNKLWTHVNKLLGYKEPSSSRNLKNHYEKILYPFLLFEAGITIPDGVAPKNDTLDDIDYDTSSPVKKLKENEVKEIESINCLVCGRGDDEAFMLLCDGCDDSYHTFCLLPPMKEIPKGDWRCPICVSQICKKPTESYGFEQSKHTYSLNEFGEMSNKFKSNYFKKPHHTVGLDETEREFWRILSSPDESVSVEYGADLHTLEVGSGFPTKSYKGKLTPSEQEYISSPWNLNNISCLEKSVLSQMNVEISGMKVPWAYVGMCFSCFCWHVEDHWSYSINYLHFGEIKTWYGVSGAAAPKFEQVMKMNAAELFEKSPDLLHHLVTIMNPNILRKNNVPIFKVNQNVGEFVVTFPRAYHAGFNQGFNFAEAVNFCPADWMPLGRAAIESYKLVKRHTVFSHDELACKIATNKDLIDINTAFTVQRELKIIYENEKKDREFLIEKGVKNSRKLIFELVPDDERTCFYCKTTCFVSALRCSCKPDRLVCLSHFDHLCESTSGSSTQNKIHKLTLLYRYSMKELFDILSKLSERTYEYSKWLYKVERILNFSKIKNEKANNDSDIEEINMYEEDDEDEDISESNKKPKIDKLFKLLEEARLKKYPRYDNLNKSKMYLNNNKMFQKNNKINEHLYNELEKEYNKAIKCAKTCKDFINFYKNHNSVNNNIETDEGCEIIYVKKLRKLITQKPSLDELKQLVSDMENLICDIEEKDLFLSLFNEALDYEIKIENLINEWNLKSPNQIKRILNYLDSIDIEFPFLLVEQLKLMYRQSLWLDKVNTAIQNPKELTINMLKEFINKSIDENLLMNLDNRDITKKAIQKTIIDLQELLSIAQTWDQKVKSQIESKNLYDLNVLEATLSEAKYIPAKLENVEKLDLIVKEASKLILNADKLLKEVKCPYLSDLELMLKTSKQLPVKISQMQAIEIRTNLTNDWIKKITTLFKRPDNDISILEVFYFLINLHKIKKILYIII